MGRKAIYSPEEKLQIVLSVLRGETTQTEISRRLQMSQTTIAKWQRQFLDGGAERLARGDRPTRPANRREEELEEKVEDLTSALGEAYVELRVWRKGGGLFTRVRSDRGPEARGQDAGGAPCAPPRYPLLDLVLLAQLRARRTTGKALADAGARCDRGADGRALRALLSMGPSQDLTRCCAPTV